MLTLIIQLVIVAIILGLVVWLAQQIPFLAPFAHIIKVVAVVIFVIYCLYILLGFVGGSHLALPK